MLLGCCFQHSEALALFRKQDLEPFYKTRIKPGFTVPEVAANIKKEMGSFAVVKPWSDINQNVFLAVKHPELVRTVVLAEPPVLRWAEEKPEGRILFNTFMDTWRRVGDALRLGKREEALRLTFNYFIGEGAFEQIPEAQRNYWMQNIREWQALTTSRDAFPILLRADVRRMKVPALMLSGGRTLEILQDSLSEGLDNMVPDSALIDPERPLGPNELVEEFCLHSWRMRDDNRVATTQDLRCQPA